MSRASVIVRNPAFIEELGPDGDEVDPADLAPSVSESDQIITVVAPEDEEEKVNDILKELERSNAETEDILRKMREIIYTLPEDASSKQDTAVPNIDV